MQYSAIFVAISNAANLLTNGITSCNVCTGLSCRLELHGIWNLTLVQHEFCLVKHALLNMLLLLWFCIHFHYYEKLQCSNHICSSINNVSNCFCHIPVGLSRLLHRWPRSSVWMGQLPKCWSLQPVFLLIILSPKCGSETLIKYPKAFWAQMKFNMYFTHNCQIYIS